MAFFVSTTAGKYRFQYLPHSSLFTCPDIQIWKKTPSWPSSLQLSPRSPSQNSPAHDSHRTFVACPSKNSTWSALDNQSTSHATPPAQPHSRHQAGGLEEVLKTAQHGNRKQRGEVRPGPGAYSPPAERNMSMTMLRMAKHQLPCFTTFSSGLASIQMQTWQHVGDHMQV